jgi:hypothetical protein
MPKITLFQNDKFGGKYLTLLETQTNLKNSNFNDITSAVIVCSGNWVLYEDSDFKGQQWVVKENGGPSSDGLYPSYKDWGGKNDSVSSIKPV